jgi:cell division protein FtsW
LKRNAANHFLLCALILSIIGVVFIYSASSYWSEVHYAESTPFFVKQLVFLLLAVGVYIGISRMHLDYPGLWISLYWFTIFLLVIVCIPGIGVERNGSRSWLAIGPILVQPAELAKVTTLVVLSYQLAQVKRGQSTVRIKHLLTVLLPVALTMLQPDFGSAFILVMAVFVLLYIGRYPLKFYMVILTAGAIGMTALIVTAPYRLKRIQSYLDPWQDPLGSGFQAVQSLLAIGPGGFWGQGFLKSRQKYLYLPEPQNDFIFSIILEEIGFVGGVTIICIFAYFLIAGFMLARSALQIKRFYVISSLVAMIAIQIMLNIGVVTGLLPVTGVTLPFISYGGSSLLINWMTVAIIISFARNQSNQE